MPPWHPHWSFPLCDCYLLSPSNSSVICPIGRQVPCNDNLLTLTFLTPVVPLLGSHASAHPASARLHKSLQRETLSTLHRSQNAVGNCKMCSWMIGNSPNYNHLLHSIDGGTVLRKLHHPMPNLNGPVNPSFNHPFILEEHKKTLQKKVDVSHLHPNQPTKVYDLIHEF